MGRWPTGSAQRLKASALELFEERGYSHVTGAEIARRAGMSERTFFRHFRAKEDVLFEDYSGARDSLRAAISAGHTPVSAAEVIDTVASFFHDRFETRRAEHVGMAAVVAGEPALVQRLVIYEQSWIAPIAEGLEARGMPALRARLLAGAMATAFRAAYDRWLADDAGPPLRTRFVDGMRMLGAVLADL